MNHSRLPQLFFIVSTLCCSISGWSAEWQPLPPLPESNGGFIAGAIGDDVVILGGTNWRNETKHWLDKIWVYRSGEHRWRPAGTLPSAMAYAAVCQNNDGIFFVGGSDGQRTHHQLYRLDARFQLQSRAAISQRVVYAGAAVAGAAMYVLGGATDASDLKTLSDEFFTLDLADGKSKALPAFPGGRVTLPVLVAMGDRIFVFTGAFFDPAKDEVLNVDRAYVYSIPRATWKPVKSFPFPVRGLAGVALDDRHIFLGGGYKSDQLGFTDEAFLYDTRTDTYHKTTPLPYRAMASPVKSGENLYWLGGEDQKRHRTDQFYKIAWRDLISAAGH